MAGFDLNNTNENLVVSCTCTKSGLSNVIDISDAVLVTALACGVKSDGFVAHTCNSMFFGASTKEEAAIFINKHKGTHIKRAIAAHAHNPQLDAVSVCGETSISEFKDGTCFEYTVTPEQFGIKRADIVSLRGATHQYNTNLISDIFKGKIKDAKLDFIVLNAGFLIYLAGVAKTPLNGIIKAYTAVNKGLVFERYVNLCKPNR